MPARGPLTVSVLIAVSGLKRWPWVPMPKLSTSAVLLASFTIASSVTGAAWAVPSDITAVASALRMPARQYGCSFLLSSTFLLW